MIEDIKQIEQICNTQFNCKVRDLGYGIAVGKRTIEINVGMRQNPAYDPNSPLEGMRKARKMIPDTRTVYIPTGADEQWIIDAIQNIKKTLHDYREIPVLDNQITGIESRVPAQLRPVAEPTPSKQVESQEDFSEDDVETSSNDKDTMVLDALTNIADTLNGLVKRVDKLEEKKKGGRPINKPNNA